MPFSDVQGHGDIITRLQGLVASGAVGSGYLFTGPDGIGKSLLMRRFVQALFCAGTDAPDSCGTCPACRRIEAMTHPDVHRVEPESGKKLTGIELLRDLQAALSLRALEGRWKAVLIPDAHLMTPQAQNSFLKTLEEPPGATVMCLAAPSPRSVLPTVVSRCQLVACAPLTDADCRAVLDRVWAEAESRPAEDEVAIAIHLAAGSPGAALALLDSPVLARRRELLERLVELETRYPSPVARFGRIAAESEELTKGKGAMPVEDLFWLYGSWAQDLVHAAWGCPIDHTDMGGHLEEIARRVGPAECVRRLDAVETARRAFAARNLNARLTVESVLIALTGGGSRPAQEIEL